MVFSARLHDSDTATVVRVSGGEILTTDGPFVEAKEHLGGFYGCSTWNVAVRSPTDAPHRCEAK